MNINRALRPASRVVPGRYTAQLPPEHVVFLIGMRINDVFAISSWLPAARAMPRMLAQLAAQPELGMLHHESFVGWRMFFFVQYWESFEKLERFARAKDLAHVPAWREFNRRVGTNGKVGIFHETFVVRGDRTECIYNNMPRFGLGAAFEHVPVAARGQSAGKRIGARAVDEPAEPVPK
ncbi:MAG: DUF4188 domain-containing protein [Sandaracinaceae bacterium]